MSLLTVERNSPSPHESDVSFTIFVQMMCSTFCLCVCVCVCVHVLKAEVCYSWVYFSVCPCQYRHEALSLIGTKVLKLACTQKAFVLAPCMHGMELYRTL